MHREIDRKLSNKVAKEKIYKVEVKKVLVNKTDQEVEKGMVIEISHTTSFNVDGVDYDVVDSSIKELPNGNYILFLNKIVLDNETFFVNNSPNHLYLLKENKFTNLVKGTKLEKISEVDLVIN